MRGAGVVTFIRDPERDDREAAGFVQIVPISVMPRNDRSIDPDPHQPRRVTTTLNKHEGSPFASTKSTPITGQ